MPEPSPTPGSISHQSRDYEGEQTATASRMLRNQVVFRVKDKTSVTKPSQLLPNQEAHSTELVYHARRPHRKSRAGCANCKRRRVKCDETKPDCRKCQVYGISCDYSAIQVQPRNSSMNLSSAHDTPDINTVESSLISMSLSDIALRVDQALKLASPSDEGLHASHAYVHSKTLASLHHFVTVVAEEHSGPKTSVEVMARDVVRVAFTSPYLMHTLLGAASTHLRRYSPDGESYRVAENYHWRNAIKLYRKELTTPIGPHNVDPLMSTSMLLAAVLGFCEEQYRPTDSWLFSSDPTALNWLLIQSGLRSISVYAIPYLQQSIWFGVFMERIPEAHIYDNHTPGREGLHSELADLCGIDETTTEDKNPYHWPLRLLSPLLKLEPIRANWSRFNGFVNLLLPEFTNLLLRKDTKALVILGYWLGKMCLVNDRWFNSRFSAECIAICMYLENSDDCRVLKLLEYPAECCGYLLRHVKEEAVFEANFDLVGLF